MYGLGKQDVKAMVARRETSLKQQYEQGLLNHEQKDWQLVYEFTGWAQTNNGHFVYVYFVGKNGKSAQELAKVENWEIVHKDHLSLFHTRIGIKDMKPLYKMGSLDVKETGDGRCHLSLDVRFVANKWFNSTENERWKSLLKEKDGLSSFKRGPDYIHTLHNQVDVDGGGGYNHSYGVEDGNNKGCEITDMFIEDFISQGQGDMEDTVD
jgi:hypothetical protein